MLLFESFNEIESICQEYNIRNYTINPDGTVDGDVDIDLSWRGLTKIPFKFGRVTGNFDCSDNKLITLEGSPKEVGGNFYCGFNKLTSLEGGPKEVRGNFYCSWNKLTTLEDGPKYVGGDFLCYNNPIYSIYKLFGNYKSYLDSMDYGYLRGTDIVKSRFKEALEEINVELPESIPGYKYI